MAEFDMFIYVCITINIYRYICTHIKYIYTQTYLLPYSKQHTS